MIKAKFYLKNNKYFGFQVKGHAEYADPGEDILCSAVSALTINTINSIEDLCTDVFTVVTEDDGNIKARVEGDVSPEAELLMKSLRIGLISIYEEYGDDYLRVFFKEV